MEQDILVLSPEKTILSFRLCGLGARITAQVVDLLFVVLGTLALSVGASLLLGWLDMELAMGSVLMIAFAVPFGYFVLLEGLWNGQTLGKKMMSLRVRMADGTPITFFASVARNLLRVADFIPGFYFVGLLAVFTNPKAQRLGDLVAGTIVVYERREEPRYAPAPHSAGTHRLEAFVGELRGMTIEEYHALRRFADRFPELAPDVQERLTDLVWIPFARRRKVPSLNDVHPIYLAEAVVMKYGRRHGLV